MYLEDLLRDLDGLGPALEELLHVAEPARVGALHRVHTKVVPARRVEVDELVGIGHHAEMELVGEGEVDELHGGDTDREEPPSGITEATGGNGV